MAHRRSVLFASASMLAVSAVAAPALAQQAAGNQPTEVQEVVVTGIRASLQKAIQIKKGSDDLVDAISAEDIGKLPDRNVADALQRIPGINTFSAASGEGGFDENDRVSVRGTPFGLTNVTIDGHSVSTGDWFIEDQYQTVGRSVSFTLLPSEIVNNVVVDKSQNASLMEGGSAGSIDIQTRSPLSLTQPFTAEASVEGAYNSLTGTTKPQINGLLGWKSADDTFGVLVQGFYEDRDVRRYGQEVLGWSPVVASSPLGQANPSLVTNGTVYPTLIGSALFEQQRIREGGDFVAQWRPNDQFELKLTAFYSDLSATNFNSNYMFWGAKQFGTSAGYPGVMPTSYTVKDNAIVSATFPDSSQPSYVQDSLYRSNAESQSEFINLDGKYRVNDRLTITGQIGYTHGLGYTPYAPSFESSGDGGVSYAPSGNGFAVTPISGVNPGSPNGMYEDWAWNETFRTTDKETYGKLDADYRIDDGLWKDVEVGGRIADHTRQVEAWDRGCTLATPLSGPGGINCIGDYGWAGNPVPFSVTNPTAYPSGFNAGALGIPGLLTDVLHGTPSSITSVINAIPDADRGDAAHTDQPINNYWLASFKVHETDYAAYAMARVGGDRWRANFGARLVVTDENNYVNTPAAPNCTAATCPGVLLTSAFGPYYVENIQHTYVNILPSANFTFDLKPDLLLRVDAAESMSRPDFSALGGPVNLTNTNLTGTAGNPNLRPITSDNFNVGLEWYYSKQSLLSADVFYMNLKNYVGFTNYQATYLNQQLSPGNGPPVYSVYTISHPIELDGQIQGFELTWQTPIKYGFGFLANYTYTDGSDSNGNPIIGDAKDTFNITGYYEAHGLSARLAYTWRSHVYIGMSEATEESQTATGSLDAAVNYNLTKNVTITLQGLNLTNELLKYYAANTTEVRAVYENGTQAYFGIRFKY